MNCRRIFYQSHDQQNTMDCVNEYQYPQVPVSAHLGNFVKLPLEIRFLIWEYLFYDIHTAPHVLSILRCNRHLYQEISDHLYNRTRHELRISCSNDSVNWLYVRLLSNRMSAKWWGLKNIKAVRRHLYSFPHKRIEGKEIFVNFILSSHEGFEQFMRLVQKADRLVDILKAAPVTPAVCGITGRKTAEGASTTLTRYPLITSLRLSLSCAFPTGTVEYHGAFLLW